MDRIVLEKREGLTVNEFIDMEIIESKGLDETVGFIDGN